MGELLEGIAKLIIIGIPFLATWWVPAVFIHGWTKGKDGLQAFLIFVWAIVGIGPAMAVAGAIEKAVFEN